MHVDTNSHKVKGFWVGMVKNGCEQSSRSTLKLIVSQECTDGVRRFFDANANSGKLKSVLLIFDLSMVWNGHEPLVCKTVKPAFKTEFMYWANVLHANSNAMIFG